ncbi:MAG: carbon-nitrogen hydrolase family protein [Bdellovibrionota bacterium]
MLVAAVQLTSTSNKKKNLSVATSLMQRAARQGAKLIALPECFSFMGSRAEILREAERPEDGLAYRAMRNFAKKNEVYVLAGSIATRSEKKSKRVWNRSVLFGPTGDDLATYDKIHLFDAHLTQTHSYRESALFERGSTPTVVDTPFGKLGLTICYDLRFPELFRNLALRGAKLIFVPAAFTLYTGKDHWLTLLKARAIENQVYIVAPGQIGKHPEGNVSFGKTCVIDPWGNIVALASDCETAIMADIDFKFLSKVRKELPALKHLRKDLFRFV